MEQHAVNSSNVLAPMLVGFRQEMGIDINSISARLVFSILCITSFGRIW